MSFDTWIQLLGMLGVLGGLVFVGFQETVFTIALAAQSQARAIDVAERVMITRKPSLISKSLKMVMTLN